MRAWWRDHVDYRWLVRTLRASGALGPIKAVVGAGGALIFVITVLNWISPTGPTGALGNTIYALDVLAAGLWALFWWFAPWPSERVSLLLLATADVLITAGCLSDSDRLFAAMTAMMLIVTGAYLTLFHGSRILVLHTLWAVLTVFMLAVLMVVIDGGALAPSIAVVLTMAAATVGVLPPLHFCYWLLRMDALSDPLTGLLNRRGLDYYLSGWFDRCDRTTPICVMTVDLDRFKTVNDTLGHSAGDQVLIRIAACLRAAALPGAIVARSGGEEFVVVERLAAEAAAAEAERLCRAIAASDAGRTPVTASIGVVVLEGDSRRFRPDYLLRGADEAMYRAKRSGGNTVVMAGPDENVPVSPRSSHG